jgi:uncharacterized membrane protein
VIAYYSLAQKEMKSHFKLGLLTVCMAAWSMSAFAGSIETFNYSTNLTGVIQHNRAGNV